MEELLSTRISIAVKNKNEGQQVIDIFKSHLEEEDLVTANEGEHIIIYEYYQLFIAGPYYNAEIGDYNHMSFKDFINKFNI